MVFVNNVFRYNDTNNVNNVTATLDTAPVTSRNLDDDSAF